MKITVDIDWIDDGNGLDEGIQERMVREVVASLHDPFVKMIKGEASSRLNAKIDGILESALDEMLAGELVLTDLRGDVKKRYENIDEMVAEKLSGFMTATVDKDGKVYSGCSYGGKFTRLEYVLNNRIQKRADAITESIVEKVDKEVNDRLNAALHEKMTDFLVKKLDMSSIITDAINNK